MYNLIVTAKMNDVDPQAWLADVLARIAMYPAHRLDELLPYPTPSDLACRLRRTLAAQPGAQSPEQHEANDIAWVLCLVQ